MNNVYFHFLLGSGKLTPHTEFIQKTLESHLKKLAPKLSLTDLDIVIEHDPDSVIPETGACAWCLDPHVIHIVVDVDRSDFKKIVTDTLYGTLVHEGHHLLRWRGPGYGCTLGEAIVSEGLACRCEEEYTTKRQPWDHALSPAQIKKYLPVAYRLRKKQYDHNKWFFGTQKTVPRWAGYTLGYFLVEKYLKTHPQATAISLCNTSADIFWKQ